MEIVSQLFLPELKMGSGGQGGKKLLHMNAIWYKIPNQKWY